MLKINSSTYRDLNRICTLHYEGVKKSISQGIARSGFPAPIKEFLKKNIEAIITSRPEHLEEIEFYISVSVFTYLDWNLSKIKNKFRRIFNYDNFLNRNLKSKWNTYSLADNLKINTCVYCNGNFTFAISKNLVKVTRPQFDHFFSQEEYPLLRLSFYNLIPSCPICNGATLKGKTQLNNDDYLHPYLEGYENDARFTYIPLDYASSVGKSNNLSLRLLESSRESREKIIRQKKLFKTEEIYNCHVDYVQELILKAERTKGNYFGLFKHLFGPSVSKKELYRLALGNYSDEEDLHKRILSKMTKDLAIELGLIKE